jgi:hypothetical protein
MSEKDKYWQQKLIQIPTMAQLLSQRLSCEVLYNLLSSGEKCIFQNDKNRKYRYYDPMHSSKYKNQEELGIEFRNQVRCFQACFLDDCQNNGGFRYPDNLDKKDIIEDINSWKEIAKKRNDQLLYETYKKFLKLLEGEKIIVDKIKIENQSGNSFPNEKNSKIPNNKIKDLLNAAMLSNQQSYEMEDMIKKDYQNGNYSIIAKLYCDPPKEKSNWKKFKEFIGYEDYDDLK